MNTLQELLERVKADFFAHDPVYTECTALGREDVSDYSPFICTDRFVAEDVLTDENEAKKWLAVLMEFGPLVGGSGEELGYIQSHDTTWQEVAQRLLVA